MLGRDKWFGNGLIKCLDGYPHVNGFRTSGDHGNLFLQLYTIYIIYISQTEKKDSIYVKLWLSNFLYGTIIPLQKVWYNYVKRKGL